MLARLLASTRDLESGDHFSLSVLVVDNDAAASAWAAVDEVSRHLALPVQYLVEPEQSIARARNSAVENAKSNLIAFIDDDEWPEPDWLVSAFQTMEKYFADGVLGPVRPEYEGTPPKWVLRGKFYDRQRHQTGTVLSWQQTRTGNALLRRELFASTDNLFRHQFGRGGEDRDLFRRLISQGYKFVWCDEAVVHESIPAARYSRWFMLRRALVRGTLPHFGFVDYCKSIVAIPLYTLLLPVFLVTAHHLFMSYLIKIFDHSGRLLSLVGLDLVKEKYLTG